MTRSAHFLVAAVACCLACFVYSWKPASFTRTLFTRDATEPYQQLAEGLLSGHLHLLQRPAPELVRMRDPYDPALNAPYRVQNLSYFRGRYFLYHGIAPALMFIAPVRLITGRYPTEICSILFFCTAGFAASAWLVIALRRRRSPDVPPALLVAILVSLAFVDGYQAVVRGPITNHVAIAGAYFFAMSGLAALAESLSSSRAGAWAALGSACLGLAVASRPNYVIGAALLLGALLPRKSSDATGAAAAPWPKISALLAPFAAIVALILAYNWLRFGNILEFGQRYMLGGWDQRHLSAFGLGSAWPNARQYLIGPPRLSPYFPFLTAPNELAVGILWSVPWLWLAPAGAWALLRLPHADPIRRIGLAALLLGTANLGTLILLPSGLSGATFSSANERYIFDFQPFLCLFTAVGLMALQRVSAPGSGRRRTLPCIALIAASASFAAALSLDFQVFPANTYVPLARICDAPSVLLERLRGFRYGPVSFTASFPANHIGATEPLLSVGRAGSQDLVYVKYLDAKRAVFGFRTIGAGDVAGEPVAMDYGRPHRVEIWLGSLLPPLGHPSMAGVPEAVATLLSRRVRVALDSRVVLDDVAEFHPASPRDVSIGRSPGDGSDGLARQFGGRIGKPARLPVSLAPADIPPPRYGDVSLVLKFPTGRTGAREPIVVTGVPEAGDFVYLIYLASDRIQFGFDHWGHPGLLSAPIRIDFSAIHTLQIGMESLEPKSRPGARDVPGPNDKIRMGKDLRILLDGTPVLRSIQETYESSPYEVSIGRNPIGGSTCGHAFTGSIIGMTRIPGQ